MAIRLKLHPQFVDTDQQPRQSVVDAINQFFGELDQINNDDYVGLVEYASNPTLMMELQDESTYDQLQTLMESRQVAHYGGGSTNTGGGLEMAIDYLIDSAGADGGGHLPRGGKADKVIILLTDGMANVGGDGYSADEYAWHQADRARELGITIHTFSIGANADWDMGCPDDSTEMSECGVGQFVAHLANGTATRIVGDFEVLEEEIAIVLKNHTAPSGQAKIVGNASTVTIN